MLKKFDKLLVVVDPANGVDLVKKKFFILFVLFYCIFYIQYCFQVIGHWNSNPKPEMILEKLQQLR